MGPLVSVEWLGDRLGQPGIAVVDCRWRLGEPGAGRRLYEAGHIPGAGFLDVDDDLSGPPGAGGRHPLPAPARFAAAAARAGVGPHSFVVAYDEAGDGGAARLWWLLRHFGHSAVAVLDGGLRAWRAADAPLAPAPPSSEQVISGTADQFPEAIVARPRSDDVAAADELGEPGLTLLDARAPERYRGEVEPVDPVAGHIPGARNVPFAQLAPGGRYRPAEELRALIGEGGERVAYCGSGITAATVVLAAEAAGLPPVRLYPGGWSEWVSVHAARDD